MCHLNLCMVMMFSTLSVTHFASDAEAHRILVLDNLSSQGAATGSRIRIVEVESGKTLAEAKTGYKPDIGLSTNGDMLVVLTDYFGGNRRGHCKLEFYRTSDLKLIDSGMLPINGRNEYFAWPSFPAVGFSPSGKEVLVQQVVSYHSNDKPISFTVDDAFIRCVKRELGDGEAFMSCLKETKIPRSRSIRFLRVADWPTVQIWNSYLGAIESVDLSSGKIQSRVGLYDDPRLQNYDPSYFEKPEIGGKLYLSLSTVKGEVVTRDGRYAYYIPQQPHTRQQQDPGYIRKIDLTVHPPKVVKKSDDRQHDLRSTVAVVTGSPRETLFVVKDKVNTKGSNLEDSRSIRVFSTVDLKFLKEIELSISDCGFLEASRDGEYVYALDRENGRLAVVDVATGREFRVLDSIGKYPVIVLSLPYKPAEKE